MAARLRLDGLFRPDVFSAWTTERQREIRRGVAAGMADGGAKVRDRLRGQMRQAFRIRRNAFVNVMTYKVFDERPDKLPGLLVGAIKAPWLETHEIGATIRGRGRGMLIPLFGRISAKRFRALVTRLMRQGNAHFAEVRGKVLLFAENLRESSADLARFKRGLRKSLGGGRIKRSADIPIAVLVPRVKLRARLKVQDTVRQSLPLVVQSIEARIKLR